MILIIVNYKVINLKEDIKTLKYRLEIAENMLKDELDCDFPYPLLVEYHKKHIKEIKLLIIVEESQNNIKELLDIYPKNKGK